MEDHEAFIKYNPERVDREEMIRRSREFYKKMDQRRSIRSFSSEAVPKEVIENCVMAASTAPSGAHKQPWSFCVVSGEELKTRIRAAAEKEEYENYHGRMSDRWLKDLAPLGTDHIKEFLEVAPYLIVVFKKAYEVDDQGKKQNNYYVNESVGIAVGILITALHQSGLSALTHTPSPMNFLAEILGRPANERAYVLIPVGYPKGDAMVPYLERKPMSEVLQWY